MPTIERPARLSMYAVHARLCCTISASLDPDAVVRALHDHPALLPGWFDASRAEDQHAQPACTVGCFRRLDASGPALTVLSAPPDRRDDALRQLVVADLQVAIALGGSTAFVELLRALAEGFANAEVSWHPPTMPVPTAPEATLAVPFRTTSRDGADTAVIVDLNGGELLRAQGDMASLDEILWRANTFPHLVAALMKAARDASAPAEPEVAAALRLVTEHQRH